MGPLSRNSTIKNDIDLLQSVQNRQLSLATSEIKRLPFQSWRHFIDLCQAYKLLNDYYKMEVKKLFTFSNTKMFGHSRKFMKHNSKTIARFNFFALREISRWKSLPSDVETQKCWLSSRGNWGSFPNKLIGYWLTLLLISNSNSWTYTARMS